MKGIAVMTISSKFTKTDWARLREIIAILAKYGFSEFMARIKLSTRLKTDKAVNSTQQYLSTPQRMRMAMEELGPTFIKLGQILSTRVDVFGQEWTEEFTKLQNAVTPIADIDIYQLIQSQLNQPIDSIFRYIDPKPIGAASIAQVHKAILHTGDKVAIKIKRPNIDDVIASDLRILKRIAQLLEAEVPESRHYHPIQLVEYFAYALRKETDLSIELRNIQQFNHLYENHQFLHIPKVYPAYSNRHLLIQEYIDDILLKDIDVHALNKKTKRLYATHITDTLLNMILHQGCFHADPHPGNIFINTQGGITLIDFGLTGQLTPNRQHELLSHSRINRA